MLLALDTATPAGSVAVGTGERVLSVRTFDAPREHSARLFVELDAALADARCERSSIEGVAVTTGPGSFTGLRIGLSAAKGLCLGLGVPLFPVNTLDVLAARLPYCRVPVCALLDARQGEVYAALYDTSAGLPDQLQAPCVAALELLLAQWSLEGVLFTGDGADRWQDVLATVSGSHLAPAPMRRPCADAALWLAGCRPETAMDAAAAEALYLRTPVFVPAASSRSAS